MLGRVDPAASSGRSADGYHVGILETADLDVAALDEPEQARVHTAMQTIIDGLVGPLQILVRSRELGNTWDMASRPESTGDADFNLDRVLHSHLAAHRTKHHPLNRRVLLVFAADDDQQLGSAINNAIATLGAVGIASQRLLGSRRDELFADHGSWVIAASGLHRAGEYVAGMQLERFPGSEVDSTWLRALFTAPVTADVCIHIQCVGVDDALRTLQRRLRDNLAERMAVAFNGRIEDARVDVAVANVDMLRERLAANRARPVRVGISVLARAASPEQLADALRAMHAACAATGAYFRTSKFQHQAVLQQVRPLAQAASLGKLADSTTAATCLPWCHVHLADVDGYALGFARNGDVPVSIDPFATATAANANVAILAQSGHGKSFTLGLLMLEATRRGRGIVLLDPEGEYRGLIANLGGRYVDLAPGSGGAINVFETGFNESETRAAVITLVGLLCGSIDHDERAAIDHATTCALADGAPTLRNVLEPMRATVPRLANILERFCQGPLGDLLAAPSQLPSKTDSPLAIGYRDLPSDLVGAVTFLVAQWMWTLVRRDRRRRHIVVDEVGLLLSHPALRELLVMLARRCRKYDASLVVATQNASDLLSANDTMVIASNASIILLGGQRHADIARMRDAFGITEAQARRLAAAQRGEFLVLSGQRRLEISIEAPPEYVRLMAP